MENYEPPSPHNNTLLFLLILSVCPKTLLTLKDIIIMFEVYL